MRRLAEAVALFTELEDHRGLGWALFYDGVAGWGLRTIEASRELFERSVAEHQLAADPAGELFSTLLLGWVLGAGGEVDEGRAHIDRFVKAAHAMNVPNAVAHAGDSVAMFDVWQGRVSADTTRAAAESLRVFREINNYACLTHALGSASMVMLELGDQEAPGVLIGLSQAIRERLNMIVAPYEDRSEIAANAFSTTVALDELDDATRARLWTSTLAKGRAMEPDEGIDWAIARLEKALSPTS